MYIFLKAILDFVILFLILLVLDEVNVLEKGGRTDFDVLVHSLNSTDRLTAIFAVQKVRPSMSFQDAEEFIKVLPKTILTGVSKKNAEQARRILSNGGLNVIILVVYRN
jgi:ribosomal protein L7/L12